MKIIFTSNAATNPSTKQLRNIPPSVNLIPRIQSVNFVVSDTKPRFDMVG